MSSKALSFKQTLKEKIPEWKSWGTAFDVERPIKKLSESFNNKNIKYILSIIVLLFVAGGIATLIFLLINFNYNNDTNDKDDI